MRTSFDRLAEDIGARDIGVITVHARAGVDQNHIAVGERAIRFAAMRQRSVFAKRHDAERVAAAAERAMLMIDESFDLAGANTSLQALPRAALHFERDVLGVLHQREFGAGLRGAAAD